MSMQDESTNPHFALDEIGDPTFSMSMLDGDFGHGLLGGLSSLIHLQLMAMEEYQQYQ
jgi:hypothetical protein